LFCISAIWYGVKYEQNHIPFLLLINLVAILLSVFFAKNREIKEKRERLNVQLPIPIFHAGFFRFIFTILNELIFILFFAITYAIFSLLYLDTIICPSINQFFFLNGLLLFTCCMFFMHHDLRKIYYFKSIRVIIISFYVFVYLLAIFPFFLVINFFGLFGMHTPVQSTLMYLTELDIPVFLLNFVGIVLFFFSIKIFTNRKSYVS